MLNKEDLVDHGAAHGPVIREPSVEEVLHASIIELKAANDMLGEAFDVKQAQDAVANAYAAFNGMEEKKKLHLITLVLCGSIHKAAKGYFNPNDIKDIAGMYLKYADGPFGLIALAYAAQYSLQSRKALQ